MLLDWNLHGRPDRRPRHRAEGHQTNCGAGAGPYWAAFRPGHRQLAVIARGQKPDDPGPYALALWGLDSYRREALHPLPYEWGGRAPNHLAFSPDGGRVAFLAFPTGDSERTELTVCEFAAGAGLVPVVEAVVRLHPGRHAGPVAMEFGAGGRLALAEGADVLVWEVGTGKPPARLLGHRAPVTALAFGPDGTRLVALSRDDASQEAKVWDLGASQELLTLWAGRSLADDLRLPMHFDGKRLMLPALEEGRAVMRVFDGRPRLGK